MPFVSWVLVRVIVVTEKEKSFSFFECNNYPNNYPLEMMVFHIYICRYRCPAFLGLGRTLHGSQAMVGIALPAGAGRDPEAADRARRGLRSL